jgi:hypothetical protein
MLNSRLQTEIPDLQHRQWPPVVPFSAFDEEFRLFLDSGLEGQKSFLERLRADPVVHRATVHRMLSPVYAYLFGYPDSPAYHRRDDGLEARLLQSKLVLEAELLDFVMERPEIPASRSQEELAAWLRNVTVGNAGVCHRLYDYLAEDAGRQALREFVYHEIVRNEVVDDEVALLATGLQGLPKTAVAINFFDEVGRGRLRHAHTYWLRQYLSANRDWDGLRKFRARRPWFSGLSSNVFNMLLTRPGMKPAALGYFTVSESWVSPHFNKLLIGMGRVGVTKGDIYFTAHARLDPFHAEELIVAIEAQRPRLTAEEIRQIHFGAALAVACGVETYDAMLTYLQSIA